MLTVSSVRRTPSVPSSLTNITRIRAAANAQIADTIMTDDSAPESGETESATAGSEPGSVGSMQDLCRTRIYRIFELI